MNGHSVIAGGSRRERERDLRRRAILEAAEALFGREGFHEASLARIAAEAGLAAGTVYLYFADKADLYGNVLLEKMRVLTQRLESALETGLTATDGLRAAVVAQFAFHDENRRFFEVFLHQDQMQSSALHARHWREMESLKKKIRTLVEDRIRRGQAAGEFRPGPPDVYAVAWLGITIQMIRQWIREKNPGRLAALAPLAAAIFLHGASTSSTDSLS